MIKLIRKVFLWSPSSLEVFKTNIWLFCCVYLLRLHSLQGKVGWSTVPFPFLKLFFNITFLPITAKRGLTREKKCLLSAWTCGWTSDCGCGSRTECNLVSLDWCRGTRLGLPYCWSRIRRCWSTKSKSTSNIGSKMPEKKFN